MWMRAGMALEERSALRSGRQRDFVRGAVVGREVGCADPGELGLVGAGHPREVEDHEPHRRTGRRVDIRLYALEHLLGSDRRTRNLYDLRAVKEINEKTKDFVGVTVPVKITVDKDTKSFKVEVGMPAVASLLKKEAGVEKGANQ